TTDGSTPKILANYLVSTMGNRARQVLFFAESGDDDNNPATPSENDDSDPTTPDPVVPIIGFNRQWTINAWRLRAGWARDTRNDYLLPTRGTFNSIAAEIALPGSD